MKNLKIPILYFIAISFIILSVLFTPDFANAKTLTNQDIEKIKKQQDKIPHYKPEVKSILQVPDNISTPQYNAKTLTNEDIERLKSEVQRKSKGIPKYRKDNPGLPPSTGDSGVPTVPPPRGGGGKTAVIIKKHLPYKEWEKEYKTYFSEYYRDPTLKLDPQMIVLHYSGTRNFARLWWTFVNGGMYEGKKGHLSVHYAVDKDGTIYELMPPNHRARGTYGVNHVAISIDIIAKNQQEILNNNRQMKVSFALVKWLMKKFDIPKEKVLAHYEVAKGKDLVPEYTDFHDKTYPDRYPPNSNTRGPGKAYMFKLRYYLVEPK